MPCVRCGRYFDTDALSGLCLLCALAVVEESAYSDQFMEQAARELEQDDEDTDDPDSQDR